VCCRRLQGNHICSEFPHSTALTRTYALQSIHTYQYRVSSVSVTCQFRISDVSVRYQYRVSSVSVPCQFRISAVSVPYQCRPCDVRHRKIVTCILNTTILVRHTERAVLIRNWHVTDECESTLRQQLSAPTRSIS
jgi:hypothetical protein